MRLPVAKLKNPVIEVFCFFKRPMSETLIYIQFTVRNRPVQFKCGFIPDGMIIASGDNKRRTADLGQFTAAVKVQYRMNIFQKSVICTWFCESGKKMVILPDPLKVLL